MKRTGFAALCGFVLICTLGGCGSTSPRSSPTTTTTTRTAGTSGPSPTTDTPTPDEPITSTPASTSGPGTESTTATSTTTPAIDTAVVPKVITVAYVDAVLAKLDAINGDALRSMVGAGHLTSKAVDDLYAIYSQNLAPTAIAALSSLHKSNLRNLRTPPGNQATKVLALLYASSHCIFVKVAVDYSAVDIVSPRPPFSQYEGLNIRGPLNVREGNPTQWDIFYDNVLLRPGVVADQCTS